MPWRDPHNLWLAEFFAPMLAFAMAILRSLYDGSEPSWKRKIVEALLCGGVSYTLGYALKALGAHGDWVFFAAGVIGLFGVDYVRMVAKRGIDKKVDKL